MYQKLMITLLIERFFLSDFIHLCAWAFLNETFQQLSLYLTLLYIKEENVRYFWEILTVIYPEGSSVLDETRYVRANIKVRRTVLFKHV